MKTLTILAALALTVATTGCKYSSISVPKENLIVSDLIIVPGIALTKDGRAIGALHNRVAMAKLLVDRGMADTVLFSGGKARGGVTEAEVMGGIAASLGMDLDRILLESEATSTIENGEFSAALMDKHGFRSALVVSDYVHLMYLLPVFKKTFAERGLDLAWTAVKYRALTDAGLQRSAFSALPLGEVIPRATVTSSGDS